MSRAIELSHKKMRSGSGGPFGAVLVKNSKIVAEGWNMVTSKNDPTAHAEVTCIRRACQKIKDFSLKGFTLYTSCEPCPMCLAAIYWARIDKVYYANTRQDAAYIKFDDSHIYDELKKSIARRKVKMSQILRPAAFKVFEEWLVKSDRISY